MFMQVVTNFFLYLHIAAGFIALMTGAITLSTAKGGKIHRKAGTVFFYAMMAITATAIVLSLIKNIPFLLMVALFSGYMAFTGYRAIQFCKKRSRPSRLDWSIWGLAALFVVWMIAEAVKLSFLQDSSSADTVPANQLFHFNSFALVLAVFGFILGSFVIRDYQSYRAIASYSKNDWLLMHISRMCGAYIATLTAFLVVNIKVEPAFIPWLLPTALGTPFIAYFIRKYRTKKSVL